VIGVQVLWVQPKCQVPDVKAVTSALDGVIGVLQVLSIVVMLMCLFVFCLWLLVEVSEGKHFNFVGGQSLLCHSATGQSRDFGLIFPRKSVSPFWRQMGIYRKSRNE
jgi:hypothetical protein